MKLIFDPPNQLGPPDLPDPTGPPSQSIRLTNPISDSCQFWDPNRPTRPNRPVKPTKPIRPIVPTRVSLRYHENILWTSWKYPENILRKSRYHVENIQKHLWTSREHLWAIENILRSSWDHLKTSENIWKHLRTSENIWEHLKTSVEHLTSSREQLRTHHS